MRMSKARFVGAALALATAFGTERAQAGIIAFSETMTLGQFNGPANTTPYNYDSANLFGENGANLAGQQATFTFSYDTGAVITPPTINYNNVDFLYDTKTTEPISATVTINGITQTVIGNYFSDLQFLIDSKQVGANLVYGAQLIVEGGDPNFISGFDDNFGISFLDSNFVSQNTGKPVLPTNISDQIWYANFYFATGEQIVSENDAVLNNFWPSSAPEPSTWAMMLVGMGAIGAVIRGAHRPKGWLRPLPSSASTHSSASASKP